MTTNAKEHTIYMEKLIKKILKNKKDILLTIGVEDNTGRIIETYTYDGASRLYQNERYEIGSLTKIFTATLLAKNIYEGKISLSNQLPMFFSGMNPDNYYPDIRRIATHTSGYKAKIPFSTKAYLKMFSEVLLNGKACFNNPFMEHSTNKMVEAAINGESVKDKDHPFQYANINYSILGLILEKITNSSYVEVMEEFIVRELNLSNTSFDIAHTIKGHVPGKSESGNWIWNKQDAVIASGGLYSNAHDLLDFLTIQVNETLPYIGLSHKRMAKGPATYDMALGWKYCKDDETLWHNGGTGCFNSFIGINKKTKKRVVILSNYRSLLIDKLGLEIVGK